MKRGLLNAALLLLAQSASFNVLAQDAVALISYSCSVTVSVTSSGSPVCTAADGQPGAFLNNSQNVIINTVGVPGSGVSMFSQFAPDGCYSAATMPAVRSGQCGINVAAFTDALTAGNTNCAVLGNSGGSDQQSPDGSFFSAHSAYIYCSGTSAQMVSRVDKAVRAGIQMAPLGAPPDGGKGSKK